MFRVDQSRQAEKDEKTARRAGFGVKFADIMVTLRRDPFEPTSGHGFEALLGDLKGAYSRRLNYHNRFVYTVHPNAGNAADPESKEVFEGIVRVHTSWGHEYPPIPKSLREDRFLR